MLTKLFVKGYAFSPAKRIVVEFSPENTADKAYLDKIIEAMEHGEKFTITVESSSKKLTTTI